MDAPVEKKSTSDFPPSDGEPAWRGMRLEAARRAGFRVQKSLGLSVK
jgi:hypothetical protein